ncbi:putative duf4419 domain-containing protein [Fusarium sporotrichioides]|uniref:Putative duf4419 domain-containing protein n=1 Tax=Fusarium sporotrichioides TaxID=5514 RepID=A0A395RS11_FUSSP|nr:putative duf4419 domain-containing protein [Fusarium sporotrichioides]
MPVIIRPSGNTPRLITAYEFRKQDRRYQLLDMCPKEDCIVKCIIQSSFDSETDIIGSTNGFVLGAIKAYSKHHHLVLRPDDIWLAILTQLSFFINRNAEAFRNLFVAHSERKCLVVLSPEMLKKQDMGAMAKTLAEAMTENLKDKSFHKWIIPDFTTTIDKDVIAASIVMAGAFRSYFDYSFSYCCGMPSITLLGTKEDWSNLQARLAGLTTLTNVLSPGSRQSEELDRFHKLLIPVLDRMVETFDDPMNPEIVDFWSRMVHESSGSGVHYISGWLTAFCFWSSEGQALYYEPQGVVDISSPDKTRPGCALDGIRYHRIDTNAVPLGWASAPIDVDDNGFVYKATIVAGSMGMKVSSSGEKLDQTRRYCNTISADVDGKYVVTKKGETCNVTFQHCDDFDLETGPDTLQPVIGWWMYEIETQKGDGDEYWAAEREVDWIPTGLAALESHSKDQAIESSIAEASKT